MVNISNYDLIKEFEGHLYRYKLAVNGKSEQFMRYVLAWHRKTQLSDNIGDAVCAQIRDRAAQPDRNYSSPRAFLNEIFRDAPKPIELKRRFIGE